MVPLNRTKLACYRLEFCIYNIWLAIWFDIMNQIRICAMCTVWRAINNSSNNRSNFGTVCMHICWFGLGQLNKHFRFLSASRYLLRCAYFSPPLFLCLCLAVFVRFRAYNDAVCHFWHSFFFFYFFSATKNDNEQHPSPPKKRRGKYWISDLIYIFFYFFWRIEWQWWWLSHTG